MNCYACWCFGFYCVFTGNGKLVYITNPKITYRMKVTTAMLTQ